MQKNMLFYRFLISFVFILMISLPATAGDPNGTWQSTTGSTIKLWANMQTVSVTVITPQGQSFKWNGWWTRFSDNFSYQSSQGIHYCSFVDSNTISVKGPNGSWNKWTRGGSTYRQPSYNKPTYNQAPNIYGNWRSTSGSLIQITNNGSSIYFSFVTKNGTRMTGNGNWIDNGYTFDFSYYDPDSRRNFYGRGFVKSSSRIDVSYGSGSPITWIR